MYDALFRRLGAGEVVRRAAREPRRGRTTPTWSRLLDEATGVFMTGGNQLKLSAIVCGTPLGDAIVDAHARGAVVAGTSAGRQHPVLAHGRLRRRRGDPQAADDPGRRRPRAAAQHAVIDQHFDQRNRYGRLLMIVAQSPQLLGIGVDEDTCAAITDEDGARGAAGRAAAAR